MIDILVFILGFIVGIFALGLTLRHGCEFGIYSVFENESGRYLDMELNNKTIEPNTNVTIVLIPRKRKED